MANQAPQDTQEKMENKEQKVFQIRYFYCFNNSFIYLFLIKLQVHKARQVHKVHQARHRK